jgi:hypothetical protein
MFILNVRLRMIRDLLRLDADPELFLEQTVEDLEFIDKVLETLLQSLIENPRLVDRELEFDNLSDIEWQFVQLLTEFIYKSNPLIGGTEADLPPEIRDRVLRLKEQSAVRAKVIDESAGAIEHIPFEPVVSTLELSELLKEF